MNEIVLFTEGGEEFFTIRSYDEGFPFTPQPGETVHLCRKRPEEEVVAEVLERKLLLDHASGYTTLRLRVEVIDATDQVKDRLKMIRDVGADDHFSRCDEVFDE